MDEQGRKYIRVKGVRWFINMDYAERHTDLDLWKKFTPEEYSKYANYDAMEVGTTADIPEDYYGEMGAPITFLDKNNPDQFEMIGSSRWLGRPMSEIAEKGTHVAGYSSMNTFCRCLKKHFSVTPSHYKAQWKQNGSQASGHSD